MTYEERIKKLNSLSEFINGEHRDDIFLILEKEFEENKWNVICAAIHWFRTVEQHLNSEHLLDTKEEDYNWGKVYLFLSAVDIVIEGINDIYKIAKKNDRARLFYKDNEIFKDEEKDDWEYFKNIRAIFGAHPTKLKDNRKYIVSTYPTPYNPDAIVERLVGEQKDWDYYTFLWSKEKDGGYKDLKFGFKFKDIERYLDKCINFLDEVYNDITNMIYEYKEKTSKEQIKKCEDSIEQLEVLLEEDKNRLGGMYAYDIEKMIMLINTEINDIDNEKMYQKFRNIIIDKIPYLFDVIQHPQKINNITEITDIIDCKTKSFTSMSSYYYQKLYEYYNNMDMEDMLIDYFKEYIKPFNGNITSIEELFCLVKAYNYYKNTGEW